MRISARQAITLTLKEHALYTGTVIKHAIRKVFLSFAQELENNYPVRKRECEPGDDIEWYELTLHVFTPRELDELYLKILDRIYNRIDYITTSEQQKLEFELKALLWGHRGGRYGETNTIAEGDD